MDLDGQEPAGPVIAPLIAGKPRYDAHLALEFTALMDASSKSWCRF